MAKTSDSASGVSTGGGPSFPSVSDFEVIDRVNQCPKLASLRSINQTLSSLLNSDDSFMAQIAEVIRLDPTLTARVLDLVNSIFFGSNENQQVSNVEEASLFLGLSRISELIIATPIIEEIQAFGKQAGIINWTEFWRHSISSAIMTRELLAAAEVQWKDEGDYISGLVHNLGKIIMAVTFPDQFGNLCKGYGSRTEDICNQEKILLGWDHAKMGAFYLWNHHIAPEIVQATQYHNTPEEAPDHPELAAAVQLADHLTRTAGIQGIERVDRLRSGDWPKLTGWEILFGQDEIVSDEERIEELEETLERVTSSLKRIV
ncbi:MAG: HDOD domain-containing protein [Opitutales bacterium]